MRKHKATPLAHIFTTFAHKIFTGWKSFPNLVTVSVEHKEEDRALGKDAGKL